MSTTEELIGSGHYKLTQAAEMMDVSPQWLRRMVREDKVSCSRNDDNWIFIHGDDIDAYIASKEARAERAVARKAGQLKGEYVAAPVRAISGTIAKVKASEFDQETKDVCVLVLEELLEGEKEKAEERKAKAVAKEAEAAEEKAEAEELPYLE